MEDNSRRKFLKNSALISGGLILSSADFFGQNSIRKNFSNSENENPMYRNLGSGKYSIKVSSIGLGCMGMSYHRSFIPQKKAMINLIQGAYDLGINFFDTAEAYGPLVNEELVGEAIHPFRKEVVIATKFGFKNGKPSEGLDSSPTRIRKVVENSLRNLRTDYIDLLYQHRVDPNIPIEDVAGTVKDLIIEGKVKYFGLSEAGESTIRKAHAIQPLTALQSEYSLMTRQPENDVLKVCEELGVGFVPYSPLSRGMLTGYLNERTKYNSSNDNRPSLPRYQPENVITNWKLIDVLKDFGDYRGLTVAQVALSWLAAQKSFVVSIPGTTKMSHLTENLQAISYNFSDEELKVLTDDINKIKIVGERYTGTAAQQALK